MARRVRDCEGWGLPLDKAPQRGGEGGGGLNLTRPRRHGVGGAALRLFRKIRKVFDPHSFFDCRIQFST